MGINGNSNYSPLEPSPGQEESFVIIPTAATVYLASNSLSSRPKLNILVYCRQLVERMDKVRLPFELLHS